MSFSEIFFSLRRSAHRSRAKVVLLAMAVSSIPALAQQESPRFDSTYWSAFSAASVAVVLDAYTTITTIGPGKRCTVEGASPELYGRVPKPPRTFAVMGAELAASAIVSRKLRRRFPSGTMRLLALAPLAANGSHLQGAIHNWTYCR